MYYKLKTSFLEETLNDVLCEDGFDVLEMTKSEDLGIALLDQSISTESFNGGPQLPLDISALMQRSSENDKFSNIQELPTPQALSNLTNRDENHVIRKFEPLEELPQNKNAWGLSVSKQQPAPVEAANSVTEPTKTKVPSIKPSISSKLFQSSRSFAKRNPRKPISLNSSVSAPSTGAIDDHIEQLPDLETILIRKAHDYKAAEAIAANALLTPDPGKETIKTHVDEGWLQRNTLQNSLEQQPLSIATTTTRTAATPKAEHNNNVKRPNFGLSNIDVSKLKPEEQPMPTPATCPAPIIGDTKEMQTAAPAQPPDSDSDSVVADSEDETEQPEYRHIAKRRKVMSSNESPSSIISAQQSTQAAPEQQQSPKKPVSDEEPGKDFSADEDGDATYVPEITKTAKRKQATAKRQKTKAEKKPKAEIKTKSKPAEKQAKPRKERAAPKAKANTKVAGLATSKSAEAEEMPEEQPLNPQDLKYVLALESGDITSVPRIRPDELEQADQMAQRYISNFSAGGSSSAAPVPGVLDEKRAAARKKLEEKIAAGKLNENFVTINIQKKKFSRGKKTVNFTKYKKQQWKHKKRVAALSGPNMDMGGCDGGVLTCFNCGGVGHFAQQCKVKGDTLLPLSAQLEEDPSPFPTLEEAEQMATQGALAAHSRNIERLPQAANAAIYQSSESSSESDDADEDVVDEDKQMEGEPKPDNDDAEMLSDDPDIDFEALDAAVQASQQAQTSPIKSYVGHKIPEEFLKQAGLDGSSDNAASTTGGVKPLYDLQPDGNVPETTAEVMEALHMFGHKDFRKGKPKLFPIAKCVQVVTYYVTFRRSGSRCNAHTLRLVNTSHPKHGQRQIVVLSAACLLV